MPTSRRTKWPYLVVTVLFASGILAVVLPGSSQTLSQTRGQAQKGANGLEAAKAAAMKVRILGPDLQSAGNFAHGDEKDGLAAFLVVHADRCKVGEYVRLS